MMFTDTTQERAHVVRDVFPLLHAHSKALGLQFHGVDLYNAVPSSLKHTLLSPPKTGDVEALPCNGETGKDPGSPRESGLIYLLEREGLFTLASDEIKRCQSLSAGPNFIVRNKYSFDSPILSNEWEGGGFLAVHGVGRCLKAYGHCVGEGVGKGCASSCTAQRTIANCLWCLCMLCIGILRSKKFKGALFLRHCLAYNYVNHIVVVCLLLVLLNYCCLATNYFKQTLLAQRYGFKPLRSRILQADFELIQAAVEESSAKSLLKKWYKLDSNATPPEYLLQYPKR